MVPAPFGFWFRFNGRRSLQRQTASVETLSKAGWTLRDLNAKQLHRQVISEKYIQIEILRLK